MEQNTYTHLRDKKVQNKKMYFSNAQEGVHLRLFQLTKLMLSHVENLSKPDYYRDQAF